MGGVIHPLHQVDLLTPAERKITEKEYWAQRRGQEKLDELNQKMKEDGITPKETRYQTEKQFLRDAIDDAASTAQSPEEFSKILDEKYHIIFKISRNRYSYLHPGRKKYITGRNLGTRYTEDFLLKVKLTNLKQMAQTVAYIQEHGYDSLDDFHVELNQASDQTSAPRKSLKDTEQQLKDVNEQIEKLKDL